MQGKERADKPIWVDDETRLAIKKLAAIQDTTMGQVVKELVQKALKKA